jgi:hypothetical protein
MCLIQAGHVINPLLHGNPLRSVLDDVENHFGFPVGLWQRKQR